MKLAFIGLLLTFLFGTSTFSQTREINIIPRPRMIQQGTGTFNLTAETRIVALKHQDRHLAKALQKYIETDAGISLQMASNASKKSNNIFVDINCLRL